MRKKKGPKLVPEMASTPPAEQLPEAISQASLLAKKTVTRKGLPRFQERMLLLFTPEMLAAFWKTLLSQVKAGDKAAVQLVAEIYGYSQKTGLTVNNLMLQNQNGTSNVGRSFDSVIRRIASESEPLELTQES